MAEFTMKVGDTSPDFELQCQDDAGDPVSLSGASAQFHMEDPDETEVLNTAASITDEANGEVRYVWEAGDTDLSAGVYDCEIQITYSDSKVETFPNTGDISIEFVEEIA